MKNNKVNTRVSREKRGEKTLYLDDSKYFCISFFPSPPVRSFKAKKKHTPRRLKTI